MSPFRSLRTSISLRSFRNRRDAAPEKTSCDLPECSHRIAALYDHIVRIHLVDVVYEAFLRKIKLLELASDYHDFCALVYGVGNAASPRNYHPAAITIRILLPASELFNNKGICCA